MIHRMVVFTPDEHCHLIAETEDVRAYWVETSRCVWFVDVETGFKINDMSARMFPTISGAEDWAKASLGIVQN